MKTINTYLTFNGNCRQAMEFYKKCFKAELQLMLFAERPGVPSELKDQVMHASLTRGDAILMASDPMPGMPVSQGNNFSININCESKQEVDELMRSLSEGGKVTMSAAEMFWGAYFGMVTDKFGINWMFNYDLAKK